MIDYLAEFKKLPASIQSVMSTHEAVAALEVLERRYGVALAELVMRVLVRDIPVSAIGDHLMHEQGLEPRQAEDLAAQLQQHYFSAIQEWLSGKTPTASDTPPVLHRDADPLVARVLSGLSLPELSVRQEGRLVSAIRLRLHDVRDAVDTRQALVRSEAAGGVELPSTMADEVMAAIDREWPHAHEALLVAPTDKLVLPPLTTTPSRVEPSLAAATPVSVTPVTRLPPGHAPMGHKPSMVDVRSRSAVVGPIDELRLMSLSELRRLSTDPKAATARVKQKIELLREQSHEYMMEGLNAWRDSGAYQAYLALARRGLIEHRSVVDIIHDDQAAGDVAMTEAEFMAILNMNRETRW